MRSYFEKDGCTIYHGDCLEVLPRVTGVDLILTDPPYGVSYRTSRRSDSDPLRVGVKGDGCQAAFAAAWPVMLKRLLEDRHWYVFASPRRLHEVIPIVHPKSVIAWDKGDRGTVGDLKCGYGEAWEAILYGMKGRRQLNGPRPRNVIRHDWSGTMDPKHPTVKPVDVLRVLIDRSSDPGDIVLDPFMGSGTTIAAARDLGRRAIGIEIEERYCEVAANRLSQGVLFGGGSA